MRMRQLSLKTQANYLRIVREFSRFLGRSPDTATVEDLRGYQLHLVDHGTSPVSLNAAITGLKFFFEITLHEPDLMARMQPVRVPRTLPVVLSPDEVGRLIAATGNLKHQTALSVAYGAGLRASEVVALKVCDIDSQRMTLRIEHAAAMSLLRHGVDLSVIALWLGHESSETTQIYLRANMQLKERALAHSTASGIAPTRYKPPDPLLAFLEAL